MTVTTNGPHMLRTSSCPLKGRKSASKLIFPKYHASCPRLVYQMQFIEQSGHWLPHLLLLPCSECVRRFSLTYIWYLLIKDSGNIFLTLCICSKFSTRYLSFSWHYVVPFLIVFPCQHMRCIHTWWSNSMKECTNIWIFIFWILGYCIHKDLY